VSYLRFTPDDYRALCQLCRPLDLYRLDAAELRTFLIPALAGSLPALGQRIAAFHDREMRLLHEYLRDRKEARASTRHKGSIAGLAAEEATALAEAFRSYPFLSRFIRFLRGSLVQYFRESFPNLAVKLARMNDHDFEHLHAQMQTRRKGGPGKR
jgi:hypothetical protein